MADTLHERFLQTAGRFPSRPAVIDAASVEKRRKTFIDGWVESDANDTALPDCAAAGIAATANMHANTNDFIDVSTRFSMSKMVGVPLSLHN